MKVIDWAVPAVIVAAVGCHKSLDITAGGGGGTSTHATTAGTVPDCTKGTAPDGQGSAMKHVGLLDGACFWIDENEVTQADYAAFLADVGTSPPPAVDGCTGTILDPAVAGTSCAAPATETQPQTCVDFCSAATYCKWAGKTLCKGGDNPTDATTSRWYSACSHGGENEYPNGDKQADSGCNVATGPSDPVGTNAACKTPDGVLDLVGNVAEWVDECSGDTCNIRGGSFNIANAGCSTSNGKPRDLRLEDLGFRCCAD